MSASKSKLMRLETAPHGPSDSTLGFPRRLQHNGISWHAGLGRKPGLATICNSMRLSIVIACLNASRSLDRCLDSVLQQRGFDVEVVVADGGSRDGTVEILQRRAAAMGGSLIWISKPDSGIAEAWNRAIGLATGDWVLFLGADDRLAASDVIARAGIVLAQALPSHRVVYGLVDLVSATGEVVGTLGHPWSPQDFYGCRYNLPHQAVFHHRSLFAEFGPFDTSLKIAAAYDFLLRALAKSEPQFIPALIVTEMQIGGLSNSRLNAPTLVREELRLYRRHVGGVSWLHLWWLAKAWAKYALYRIG